MARSLVEMMRRAARRLRARVSLLAMLAVAGCAAIDNVPVAEPPNAVKRSTEKDGRFIVLGGPQIRHDVPFLGVPATNFALLRSFIDTRTGAMAHQLYVEDSYFGAERVWNAARLASGETLRFVPISKNEITCESSCSYAEEFAASLPDQLLRANPQGLTVVFAARSGIQKPISVPGDLVAKQLAAVADARGTQPVAAAAPIAAPAAPR